MTLWMPGVSVGRGGVVTVALALGAWCAPALGQLVPERVYYGVQRAIPMRAEVPAPCDADRASDPGLASSRGEVRIDLFENGQDQAVATAPVLEGPVDLAALFPVLWQDPRPRVRWAQLVVGGEEVGPPVVLQPMVTPAQAVLVDPQSGRAWYTDPATNAGVFEARQGQLLWLREPAATSGLRAYVERDVVLDTTLGVMRFRLRPDVAPNTVWAFRELVAGGFYTDVIFHRVVPKLPTGAPFVAQVGDPTGSGAGGPGFHFDLEPSALPHDFGVLSMARATDPNTNGSQVFIALSREGTQRLDGLYTSFAQAIEGADVIESFTRVEVTGQRPNDPPVLRSARLVDALPYSSRPAPVVRPTPELPRR